MSVDRVVTSDHIKVVIFKGESSRIHFLFVSVFPYCSFLVRVDKQRVQWCCKVFCVKGKVYDRNFVENLTSPAALSSPHPL
jgi:hypothetical protein